jgi:MFS family permease
MLNQNKQRDFREALRIPDIRLFIGSVGFFTLASRALAVVIGFQIYKITHSALSLGWLGLIEAIPAITIAPFGGYVADHFNRRTIILITRAASCFCTIILAIISWQTQINSLLGLYAMIFVAGVARGLADPANTAFEAQVVPKHLTVNASSWISSTWISCSVLGPAAIGFIFDARGAQGAYLIITAGFILSWIFTAAIPPKPLPVSIKNESLFKSISTGWRFVFKTQPLWTAMVLDLFSVFFGGAIILLPIYANDILHVGAKGLGLLNDASCEIRYCLPQKYCPICQRKYVTDEDLNAYIVKKYGIDKKVLKEEILSRDGKLVIRPDSGEAQALIRVEKGCPFGCFFCTAVNVSGQKVHYRAIGNV